MAEYISREDYCQYQGCPKDGYKTCKNCSMASVPTADVRPVTYGHWIEDHCDLICSNCQTHFKDEIVFMCYDWSNYPPFCPNCAADMRNRLIETEVEGLYLNIEE